MKRALVIFAALLALLALPAFAAPFIACDLAAAATHSAMRQCTTFASDGTTCASWGAWGADAPAVIVGAAKECRHDISGIAAGKHAVQVKAIADDASWGRQESAPSDPFVFTRPAAPGKPASIRIAP